MTRGPESSTAAPGKAVRTPPRVLVRAFWSLHRSIYRVSRGSLGLWRPKEGKRFGVMLVESRGRHTGRGRRTMVGYFEDNGNLITIAMNGWAAAEPAWWLNLQTAPETRVRTADGLREVRAHPASGSERERLWARVADFPGWGDDIDALATLRSEPTTVVVFEPRTNVPTVDRDSADLGDRQLMEAGP